ncbi:MAG: phosphatase PAP2 family protein [Candidatus Diapherotrites archaeon]|nr:phosphatase PAP2 family protein [Candidatus Diapherotrites archaeon]
MDFSFIQAFDVSILNFFQTIQQPILTYIFQALSLLGNPIFWIMVSAFLYWNGKETQAVLTMNLVVFSALVSNGLKEFFQRPRPDSNQFTVTQEALQELFEKASSYGYSFPSGHATLIAGIAGYWFLKVKKHFKILLVLAVLIVSLARMYLGWHYFSDIVLGLLLGLGIAQFNTWLVFEIKEKQIHFNSWKTQTVLAVVFVCLLFLYYLGINKLTFAIFGFYTGFFLFYKFKLEHRTSKLKQITGFIGFGFLGLCYLLINSLSLLWLFLLGFWITFGNAVLYQKWKNKNN